MLKIIPSENAVRDAYLRDELDVEGLERFMAAALSKTPIEVAWLKQTPN
jgi:hypothetical protein